MISVSNSNYRLGGSRGRHRRRANATLAALFSIESEF